MEEYKAIVGYENLYEVSNFGNVKSLPKSDGNGNRERLLKQEIMKTSSNTTNYRRVSLCKNGVVKRFAVHRLVAQTFIQNECDKPFVNHIDNNGENNNVSNLEWVTHSENMMHAQKQNRLFNAQSQGGLASGLKATIKQNEKNIDLIGKTFNFYKVIDTVKTEKYKRSMIKCMCLLCNNIYNVEKTNLTSGHSQMCRSCGLKKENKKLKRGKDEIVTTC